MDMSFILFELTNIKIEAGKKKSGTLSQNEMDSALVGNTGFEPVTSTMSM